MSAAPSLRAVIFDFNGVILDDEHVHYASFAELLAARDVRLSREDYYGRYLGLDDKTCLRRVLTDLGSAMQREAAADPDWLWSLVEAKGDIYLRRIAGHVRLFPGVAALIADLAAHMPLAIASGARRREIEAVLRTTDLGRYFDQVVTADEVSQGKPHPEGYTRAFELLRDDEPALGDLQPSECLVFEDSPKGVRAALAAGMRCIAVTTGTTAEDLAEAGAVVNTLAGLEVEDVAELAGFARVG